MGIVLCLGIQGNKWVPPLSLVPWELEEAGASGSLEEAPSPGERCLCSGEKHVRSGCCLLGSPWEEKHSLLTERLCVQGEGKGEESGHGGEGEAEERVNSRPGGSTGRAGAGGTVVATREGRLRI